MSYWTRLNQLAAIRFATKRAWRVPLTPMISFTFDDFPRSALKVGGRLLMEHGWRGTYYSSLALMGKVIDGQVMYTRVDLDDLRSDGHELACHTFDHVRCLDVGTPTFVASCAANRRGAAEMLGGYQMRNLSFPHGQVTIQAKYLLRHFYDTCRSTEVGINTSPIDLCLLRANQLYSRLPLEHAMRLVTENCEARGWLIFYTHDISPQASRFGCTPKEFGTILRFVGESGAAVVTIEEGVKRLTAAG